MKKLVFIGVLVSFVVSIVYAYTPPDYDNVTLTLGTGYTPPNYDNVTLILGYISDTTPPTCSFDVTPADILANSTGEFTILINCSDASGINNSRFISTRTLEGFVTNGIPNHWSIRPPSNNKSDPCPICGEQVYRADGRNDGKWYEDLGLFSDNFTYAVAGNDSPHVTITNGSTWAQLNFSFYVRPSVFRQSLFLSRGMMEKEAKKNYSIYKNNGLLIKNWDMEAIRGSENYTIIPLFDMGYLDSPNKVLELYYCNSSFDPTGSTSPQNDDDNCVFISSITTSDIDNVEYTSRNSTYFNSFAFAVTNGTIGGITASDTNYFYLKSEVPANKAYLMRYANGDSGTNVSFANSKVAWTTSNNGVTFTQASFTPDLQLNVIKGQDEVQLGVYVEDNAGNNYTNFTAYTDEVGDVNYPITRPIIKHYCQGPGETCSNGEDWDLNGTYNGIMAIHIGTSKDPDGVGTVKHSLYLMNTDGTLNYTINSSFYSVDDSDIHIDFNTSLVPDGVYKMNITAQADDNPADIQSYLTENNFTILQSKSFNITLIGESPVASNGSTLDIEFNSSGTTESQVEPCVVSGSCQNAGSSLSIFEFTNTGSVSLNWSVCINDSMPSSINIKCGGTNSYSSATNVPVCSAGNLTLQSNIAVDSTVKGYCWSDFTTALASDTTSRAITHSSIES